MTFLFAVLLTAEQSYRTQMMLQNDLFKNKELVRGGHIVNLLAVTLGSKRSKRKKTTLKELNVKVSAAS